MTKELFISRMTRFIETEEKIGKLAEAYSALCHADFPSTGMEAHRDLVLEMLKELAGDEYDTLDYWYYDLELGTKWKEGMVTEKDGTDVKLATLDDVWDYLQTNKNSYGRI